MNKGHKIRVVVTGLGVITAIGETVTAFRDGLIQGACGIGPVTVFDTTGFSCHTAAQVKKTDLKEGFESGRTKRMSRCDLLGLTAAKEAFRNSGLRLNTLDRNRVGVILGGGAGGMLSWEKYRRSQWAGRHARKPSQVLASAPCTLTDQIASQYGFYGYRATISTACSSSGTSIGYGFDLIRSGEQDVVVTGGSEALSELTFSGFHSLRLVDPEYCRPFDQNRGGLSLGEGAAILILENYSLARSRQAKIYAEVLGYAVNADAFHMTSPDPNADGMTRVMKKALDIARLDVNEVDYINAHGTATPVNDKTETLAIKKVFGETGAKLLAISSTKSMVGHCLGAAGAIEAAATVLAIHEQFVPPTIHLDTFDPECDLDYVPNQYRRQKLAVALSNSFAFGGNNTTLVLGKAD
ncbi:MAG: beta-ketoacyl-[acyl-carrier-protein] synthase family protein [Deltaproteobacteria bacterium]|nr:beta-ketoacyl-[acyl-carrier-protein] synthase family protein [Deltaproteobacteria bacterium]